MKRVFAFLILCLALAVVRMLLMVLAVVLLLALVYAFATRPRETLVFLGTMILSSLAVAQPIACIAAIAVVGVSIVVTRRRTKRPRRHLSASHD